MINSSKYFLFEVSFLTTPGNTVRNYILQIMKQKGKKYTFLTVPDVRFEEFYLFNVELKIEINISNFFSVMNTFD